MKLSRCILLGFLALAPVDGAGADRASIELAPVASSITLLAQDAGALHFRVEVGELETLEISTPEGRFTRLLIPGFHSSRDIGSPELPLVNRLFEIPYGASTRVEVLATETVEIDLTERGIETPIMPAQPSMPKNADPTSWPFVYEPAAYRVERVARAPVSTVDVGQMRGVRLGRVEVSPVEYFPQQNRLRVTEAIEFRIVFEGADHAAGDALKAATHSVFFEPLHEQIAGYRGLHDTYADLVGDVVTLVVVTPPEFEAQLQEFVDWKTERGFQTILAVKGTPAVGTTKEQIRTYIHGLYNGATPQAPAPSFVIFVGDVAQMPTFTEGGDATDRPYCAVDGDIVPDIYYGRLSATSTAQLQAILDKTLMYDRFTMPDPAYLGEAVMIAGMDSSFGPTWANGQINYGTTHYFNAAHGILSHTYLYPQSGSSSASIIQHVSDGVGYVNYTAHGSMTSWSDPSFTQSNVNGLQNAGEYCLAVGNCCLTSTYDYGECFAETWLRAPNKGAIGYIGGSNSTYWDEDYWWAVGSGSIVVNPTYDSHGLGAYDGLFHDHGEGMDQWYVTNDAIIFCGNLAVMEAGGASTYYWNIYNLMGDPSLSTYFGVPTANPVVHPDAIFTSATTLTLSAVPGSYCGLTWEGELIGAGTVPESGQLELDIWTALEPGTAQLIVMAQNRVPYTASVSILPMTGAYLVLESSSVLDDEGDGDGNLDEGETVGLEITLENLGAEVATGVTATLLTLDPYITLIEPTRSFPDIPAGGFATCTAPFMLAVAGNVPDQHTVLLNASASAAQGSWNSNVSLIAEAPVLIASGCAVVDTTWGNRDGNANAGERVDLRLWVTNVGHSDADDLSGTLSGADPMIVVHDGAGTCVTVPAGGDGLFGIFDVELDPACPEPSFIDLELTVSDPHGFSATLDFELPLGGWFDDFEEERPWTVGAPGDDATGGIWECVDPIGTTTNGYVIQMEDDHTPAPGALCFVTGNGTGGAAGENDVDAGKTTLLSPVFRLSEAASAKVSYWRWYVNAWGSASGQDWWDVEVTADGRRWVSLEHTQQSQAEWIELTFELTDYIELTDKVQIRFVASDESAESLVEAGVDDFLLIATSPYVVGVAGSDPEVARLGLDPNVPNPFNPATTIRFELPDRGPVDLAIYDVQGRRVAELAAGIHDAGVHTVRWQGRDLNGDAVASGVYFYRLSFGDRVLTRRLAVLK